jgi:hypothetical protein
VAEGIDLEKYTEWFVWARDNLARELDATHAAAEAAYRSAARGGSDDDAHTAAQAAGAEPIALNPQTMALAEWAAWALSTGRFRSDQTLVVARHALAAVQASHDLDATISDVLSVAPQGAKVETRTSPNRGPAIVVGVVAGLLVLGGATAGVISSLSNQGGKPSTERPAVNASIQATLSPSGQAVIYASGLPPNTPVYVSVDQVTMQLVETDSAGSVQATVPIPIGGHTISVCLDQQQLQCPASTFISRDQ